MRSARSRGILVAAALGASAALGAIARADDCSPRNGLSACIDADELWPHAGGGAFYAIGDGSTTPRGALAFGMVGSWIARPIGLGVASADPKGSTVYAVDGAFDVTMLFALGVTDRLELTIAAPATFYEDGIGLSGVVGSGSTLPRSALRDLRFGLAFAALSRPRGERGPSLTARLEFGAPTATSGAFAGAPTAVLAPSVAFSYRVGRFDVAAEALARVRGEARLANGAMGTQVGGAIGASFDVVRDRWLTAAAEAFVLPTVAAQLAPPRGGSATPLVPAEWIASVSTARLLGGDLVLSLGAGSSIPTGPRAALTAPAYRLDFAIRYAPAGPPT
jgi:hypothetical protein